MAVIDIHETEARSLPYRGALRFAVALGILVLAVFGSPVVVAQGPSPEIQRLEGENDRARSTIMHNQSFIQSVHAHWQGTVRPLRQQLADIDRQIADKKREIAGVASSLYTDTTNALNRDLNALQEKRHMILNLHGRSVETPDGTSVGTMAQLEAVFQKAAHLANQNQQENKRLQRQIAENEKRITKLRSDKSNCPNVCVEWGFNAPDGRRNCCATGTWTCGVQMPGDTPPTCKRECKRYERRCP